MQTPRIVKILRGAGWILFGVGIFKWSLIMIVIGACLIGLFEE